MPIYEYTCQKCNNKFEQLVRSKSGESKFPCPKCGSAFPAPDLEGDADEEAPRKKKKVVEEDEDEGEKKEKQEKRKGERKESHGAVVNATQAENRKSFPSGVV